MPLTPVVSRAHINKHHITQDVLKDSNRTTLDAVSVFVRDAPLEAPASSRKIPAALIVTGPNIASQDLLFAQLGEAVQGRFVGLRSAEAPNLKATLRKIIRDLMTAGAAGVGDAGDEGDREQVAVGKDVSFFEFFSIFFMLCGVPVAWMTAFSLSQAMTIWVCDVAAFPP